MIKNGHRQFSLAYLTVFGAPPRRMAQIASETGYDFVSLRLAPVTDDEPTFPFTDPAFVADVVRALDEYRVPVLDVELIRTDPGTKTSDWRDFFAVAEELGARHVITQIPEPDIERAVDLFQEICDLGAEKGMTIDLEFIPWTPTNDLTRAAAIVGKADAPNGAILVDTLHFARSRSSVTQLAELPKELVNFVQLCDAREIWSLDDEEFIRVARSDREPPGQASLDLRPIVEALPGVPYALEVPNHARRQELGMESYARLVREAAESFFDGIEAGSVTAAP
ncbi:MAG TPA: TIM barrel protein [Acidimicrobiia bacterium]|nr:TIM barrel protein [Acidimicrobiia bacterium]